MKVAIHLREGDATKIAMRNTSERRTLDLIDRLKVSHAPCVMRGAWGVGRGAWGVGCGASCGISGAHCPPYLHPSPFALDAPQAAVALLGHDTHVRAYTSCRDTEQCLRLRGMASDFKKRGVVMHVDDERSYRALPCTYHVPRITMRSPGHNVHTEHEPSSWVGTTRPL